MWQPNELKARLLAASEACAETPEGRLRTFVLAALGDALDGWRVGEFVHEGQPLFARGPAPELPGFMRSVVLLLTEGLCDREGCAQRCASVPFRVGQVYAKLCPACLEDLARRLARLSRAQPNAADPGSAGEQPGKDGAGRASGPGAGPGGQPSGPAPLSGGSLHGQSSENSSADRSADRSGGAS